MEKNVNEIREMNAKIAEFLGWFIEEDRREPELYRNTWFYKDEFCIRVAWCYHNDGELNFNTSWNSLMKVIKKIKNSLSTKTDLVLYNQLMLTLQTLNVEVVYEATFKFIENFNNKVHI